MVAPFRDTVADTALVPADSDTVTGFSASASVAAILSAWAETALLFVVFSSKKLPLALPLTVIHWSPAANWGSVTICVRVSDCPTARELVIVNVPNNWPPPVAGAGDRNTWLLLALVASALPALKSVHVIATVWPALALAGATTFVTTKSGEWASADVTEV